jgi:replication initiator protein RepSA
MTAPQISQEMVRDAALAAGVCARPVIAQVTDTATGETDLVPIACGSTRENRCPPCADKARRVRMQQCREGWHLDTEPEHDPAPDDDPEEEPPELEPQGAGPEDRRVRSTRRRQDLPDLPRVPMDDRTIGRAFTAPNGRTYRPSMFITLTLPSYGKVTSEGVPVDPDSYDYRRAALDALHFPKLVDRWWQNLRRCAGYRVQYFAVVEAQRRLAPHLHAAVRGAIPRQVVRQVRAATYHQVWWPAHETPVYVDQLPIWTDTAGYVDPDTRRPLRTWSEALDLLDTDPDAEPAHVLRFGEQDDIAGLLAGTEKADRTVSYLCKYLTKAIADTYDDDPDDLSKARAAHIDRLAREVRWLPCSPECSNWLRFGIQPKNARAGMVPGHCGRRAHDRENLGLGGRRVLVSRQWSGKTVAQHRADRAAVVRAALEDAGYDPDDHRQLAATTGSEDGWSWEVLGRSAVDHQTYAAAIATSIATRERWCREYAAATSGRAPPDTAAA